MEKQIVIYKTADGKTQIDVHLENETVWLSLNQMADLFQRDKSVISRHINNIYKEGELKTKGTVANFATVQSEGKRQISRDLDHYSLDVIISVGYRVNSKRGTQFRIWSNRILKEYLVQGFALNEKRLKETEKKYADLQQAVKLVSKVYTRVDGSEGKGILKILDEYSRALDLLDRYDHQQLYILPSKIRSVKELTYDDAKKQIEIWRKTQNATKLFGNEKDDSFKGSLENIYQTFDGIELYLGLEEKAAHLLYFIVKNHSFSDGNKRIGAGLFVYFLDLNKSLFTSSGIKVIDDNTLVALTLLIAESKPEEKEIMIKVIVNLLNQ